MLSKSYDAVTCVAVRVPSKKILHCANVCFSEHAIAQPCGRTTNKALKGLCGIYDIKFGML